MNKFEIKGNWNQVKGYLKEKYGDLTNDDLAYVEGKEDQLLGRLQKRIGKSKEELIEEINNL
ncbi:CsbD family protein [Saccharicrinis sp. FJH2]|uniref:CsbD family protein n=1 Tax=unclassified Saccharicrinis TaxID=2646859 RepID=UPI0035D4EF63